MRTKRTEEKHLKSICFHRQTHSIRKKKKKRGEYSLAADTTRVRRGISLRNKERQKGVGE